jgi:hypothetical protein
MIREKLRFALAVAAFACAVARGGTPHLAGIGDVRGGMPHPPAAFDHAQGVLTDELARIFGGAPTGNLAHVVFETADWPDDQRYVIDGVSTAVVIRAAGAKGFDYAAARILREVGYRRFAPHPSWEIIPANPPHSISLNADETPSYRSRNIWHGRFWPECRTNGHHKAWAFHHRMGGDTIRCGHAYEGFVRRNRNFLAEHPECLALVKGERTGNKLCISNPLLRERFTAYVLNAIRANPDALTVSVEPSDGGGWCECDACTALGSPTDRAITLANHVARAIQEEFPGHRVALYAYNQHSPPPSVAVDSNVVVMVATSFLRGGWTPDGLLQEWGRRTTVGVREYYYNPNGAPGAGRAADVFALADTLPRFHSFGARYITAETSDSWAAGLAGLNIAAELMWDVDADPEQIKADIVSSAFPSATAEMRAFLNLIDGEKQSPLSEDLIARMYGLLAEAWRKAESHNKGGPPAVAADGVAAAGTAPGPPSMERSRIAQMIGYTHYCEALLAFNRSMTEENATSLFTAAAALRPYYLVPTKGYQADGRSFGPVGKKIANSFDWNTPRPLEPERWLAEGLANNHRLPFEPIGFSDELVPAAEPADEKGQIALSPLRGRRDFLLWSDGAPFNLNVTGGLIPWYRDRGNVKLRLVQIGGESETGELETEVWRDESVTPDGTNRVVIVRPKRPGLHRLEANDGNDKTLYGFPPNLAVAIPANSESPPLLDGNFWFFVPKGTQTLGFFCAAHRGRLCNPAGTTITNLAKANGHYAVDVPEGTDGRFWSVQGVNGRFCPLTAPSALNINPRKCLVPGDAGILPATDHARPPSPPSCFRFLEIGVWEGGRFLPLRAKRNCTTTAEWCTMSP